ncbi:helix-turn-helix domain-containing protein [Streptomyces sp. NPDC127038]|uniref:helix-turn-helix domain-containing protein n=1 Tax=Streptomyces sp. NPDC127038 TaxID=3347114 RepID=UPI0036655833
MSRRDPRKRVEALWPLAAGKSQRATADEVGVHPSTVRSWLRDPVFVAELERVRAAVAVKPLDAERVMAAVAQAEARLDGRDRGPVTVVIPAGASPARRRRLLAAGIARVLERSEGDRW